MPQVLVQECERADAVDGVRTVEELDGRAVGNLLQVGIEQALTLANSKATQFVEARRRRGGRSFDHER